MLIVKKMEGDSTELVGFVSFWFGFVVFFIVIGRNSIWSNGFSFFVFKMVVEGHSKKSPKTQGK